MIDPDDIISLAEVIKHPQDVPPSIVREMALALLEASKTEGGMAMHLRNFVE